MGLNEDEAGGGGGEIIFGEKMTRHEDVNRTEAILG